jgi:primosomal protein N' (replication factor Y)
MHALQNQSTVIIGTRSALFIPQNNIKLIIVDEEHESSYKQNEHPRYHARDVAIVKAKIYSAVCVLGSATLSFETLANLKTGKYNSHKISTSYHKSSSSISIVNMCDEPHGILLSQNLNYAIGDCLDAKKQAILLLNRRGFATTVFCKACNTIISCQKCNIPMIFHKSDRTIRCHLCGFRENFISKCKTCHSHSIHYRGIGTQRAEEIVGKLYPHAKIARIDSDILSKKYEYIDILEKFKNHEIDILIGTQILAKSLDFDNVKLIGVLNADLGLNAPNFRANEHALQLLLQIAGRAGRRSENGKVFVQTNIPQHEVFGALKSNKYHEFAENELQMREDFLYPPFCRLIHIIFEAEEQKTTKRIAEQFCYTLKNFCDENNLNVYVSINAPIESFFDKINDQYRYSILIKTTKNMVLNDILKYLRNEFYDKSDVKIIIDIDPIDLC